VMYERRDELDPKPQGRFLVDFVSRENPDIGIAELASAIDLFADARWKDLFDADVYGSSLLSDVATFQAKVEEPVHIFIRPSKETALRVAGGSCVSKAGTRSAAISRPGGRQCGRSTPRRRVSIA